MHIPFAEFWEPLNPLRPFLDPELDLEEDRLPLDPELDRCCERPRLELLEERLEPLDESEPRL